MTVSAAVARPRWGLVFVGPFISPTKRQATGGCLPEEQINELGVIVPRASQNAGHFVVSNAMTEMIDFFQKQAHTCRNLAAQATKKNDREYSQRWEWLVQPQKIVETGRPLRSGRAAICKTSSRLISGSRAPRLFVP
jgi:hypothetical protein